MYAFLLAVALATLVLFASTASAAPTTAPAVGPRKVIDAARFFDPASASSGLQNAIDAAGPDGGLVVIPPGAYPLKRALQMRSNVTLRGSGVATILRKTPGHFTTLTADVSVGATEIQVKDASRFEVGAEIALRDSKQVGWYMLHAIVTAIKGHRITLDRPTVRDYTLARGALAVGNFPAIRVENQKNFTIESLAIEAKPDEQPGDLPSDFTFAAIHIAWSSHSRVRDVTVTNWPSDGIGVQGGSESQVLGCSAIGCRGHGFHPGTGLFNAVFTGNIARSNAWDGLFFCMNVRYCTVSNNVFHGNGYSGIGGLGEGGDQWNTCSANTCVANGRAGILMSDGKNNTVVGNVCLNNSAGEAGKFPAILLHNTTGCLVSGNRCSDDQEKPTQHVAILESGTSDHNLFSGNHLAGSKKAIEKVGEHSQAVGNME